MSVPATGAATGEPPASDQPGAPGEPPAPDPVVAEYLDYLEYERVMSPNTVAAYRRDLTRFATWLSRATVLEASEDDVYRYFAGVGGDGASTSVARRMAAVRGLYHYLIREKSLAADPAALLTTPKHPHGLPRVLDVPQIEQVLGGVPFEGPLAERDLALLELLYGCGLRATEIVTLRVSDVDLEGGLVRCLGKGDKERVVPLGSYAAAAAATTSCSSTPTARLSPVRVSTSCCAARSSASASKAGRALTPSATASRRIWSRAAPTCAACRRCSVTPTSPPPRSTRT